MVTTFELGLMTLHFQSKKITILYSGYCMQNLNNKHRT